MLPRPVVAVLILVLAGPGALRAADLDPFIPADTESYVSVNIRQIIESELFKKQLIAPAKQALQDIGGDTLKSTLKDLGVDPFKDVDRLIIASPGGTETDRGLIILHGKFDPAKFKTKGEEAARENADVVKLHKTPLGGGVHHTLYEVVIPNQDTSLFVALVSEKTILASPGKDYVVDALKDARAKKKRTLKSKELQALIEKLKPNQSLSLAALGKSISQADNEVVPKFITEAFGGIEAIGGGLTVSDEVKMELLLASKSGESARKMHQALDRGLKLALVGLALIGEERKELNLLLEVLKSLKVSNKGVVVSVTGRLSQDVLEDFFKKDG